MGGATDSNTGITLPRDCELFIISRLKCIFFHEHVICFELLNINALAQGSYKCCNAENNILLVGISILCYKVLKREMLAMQLRVQLKKQTN